MRTSSHLRLGVVRIYARKTMYLLQDCQDAAFKIKSMFRTEAVDLPFGKGEAAVDAITMPEMIDMINNFDYMAEPEIFVQPLPIANLRNITLDDIDGLCDQDDPWILNGIRDWTEIGSIGGGSFNIKENGDSLSDDSGIEAMRKNANLIDRPFLDDGFGSQNGVDMDFEVSGFLGTSVSLQPNLDATQDKVETSERMNANLATPVASRPNSRMSFIDQGSLIVPPTPGSPHHIHDDTVDKSNYDINFGNSIDVESMIIDDQPIDQALLDENNLTGTPSRNTLVLEPIDSQLGALLEQRRKRRKKLIKIMDNVTTLSTQQVKAQINSTSDIVTNLDLAPPTRMLMDWKKNGTSDKLFSLPERTISAKVLFQYYSRNLINSGNHGINENELNDEEEILLNQDAQDEEHHNDLSVLNDIDQHMGNLTPQHEISAPKIPKSPAPPRKKRKTEDKENKEGTKRSRDSRYEKLEEQRNHVADRSELPLHNVSNVFQDSVNDASRAASDFFDVGNIGYDTDDHDIARAGSTIRGSVSVPHLDENGTMSFNQSSYQDNNKVTEELDEDIEEEDDIFDYGGGGPMSVGPVSCFSGLLFLTC